MNSSSPTIPIAKSVVLVGAGNAHLVFVKRWKMRPLPGVAVTLVNETSVSPYSAMIPAYIAKDYAWDEITIDLVRLCQSANVRFVAEAVTRIDAVERKIGFANRPPLTFDALSLGLGSIPACPTKLARSSSSLIMRPLGAFLHKLDGLDENLRRTPQPFHLVIVGGGASGCELALAIQRRLGRHAGFRMTLVQGNATLLPQFPAKVARIFHQAFESKSVAIRLNARVVDGEEGTLLVDDGTRMAFDAVVWATNAAPPPVLGESGLQRNDDGFLVVSETLQSVSDPAIFGTGDCVSFPAYPDLPKNGVHAVRQGAVLFDNVSAFLREQPLRPFRPQRFFLCLMNTADQEAVFSYGPLAWKGRWARKLKDRIDRAWIEKFTTLARMTEPAEGEDESTAMRCGGCGSKISSDVLSAVLRRLEIADDPRVLMGCRAGEDAAVVRAQPALFGNEPAKLVEVQTVDYFKAFIDDPFLFGRIAALHSLSDLYAMNARPFTALAIATLPYARGPVQEAQLFELLAGAVQTLREAGVVLTGGHTTEGSELALGFAVTGHGEEDRLFRKGGLQPGDQLILTKPLGSGALLAAWMRSECKAAWFEQLMQSLLISNRAAGEIFSQIGVTACTDITGFGLAGHLLEMLDSSQVSARLDTLPVPLFAGFKEVVSRGILSSLQPDNAKMSCRVNATGNLPEWLFDPQTSGGLLAGVKPEQVEKALLLLREASCADAAVIGEVVASDRNTGPTISLHN